MSSQIDDLAEILTEVNASLRISTVLGARSVIHDVVYRISLILLVVEALGKKKDGHSEINATLLWFSQFLVARSDLLPNFIQWALKERKKTNLGSLFAWPLMPKGYLNDNEHVRLLSVLIATRDVDVRDTDTIVFKENFSSSLATLKSYVFESDNFKREKVILQKLKEADISLKLLGVG